MSDVTYGVKVPEELKKQLEDLQKDSGLRVGKDFVQQLVNSYVLEKTKENIPEVAEDLKELQILTQRINNIYLNLGYRIENVTKAQQEQQEKELSKKDSIISDLQNKIETTTEKKNIITEEYNIIVNKNDEYRTRVNELTESNNNIKALIEEYKRKNDMLLSDLQEFKEYKNINKQLTEQLEQFQNDNRTLLSNTINLENKITRLQGEIDNNTKMITFYESEIENKNKSIIEYKNDIKALEIKKDREIDNIKLEHKKTLEDQLKDITERLNNKYELEIANKDSEIEKLKREVEKFKLRKFKVREKD